MRKVMVIYSLKNTGNGTKAKLLHHAITSESADEKKRLTELREKTACETVEVEGKKKIAYLPLVFEDELLGIRAAFPHEPDSTGREWFSLFTGQALPILRNGDGGAGNADGHNREPMVSSLRQNVAVYGSLRGNVNGKPSLIVFSHDLQRALIISSREVVIQSALDNIGDYSSTVTGIAVRKTENEKRVSRKWNTFLENAEWLQIRVTIPEQVIEALKRYMPYLAAGESKVSIKGPQTQQNGPEHSNPTLRQPLREPNVN
jgi:hypothetical protein